ncbi:hypothetical protein, partial [Klebsiella pneumoniae]|uniref:hypothetical protein n=1 Tax=Klebsiella pneumoniae TaxID=573 RepID=UPI001D01D6E5
HGDVLMWLMKTLLTSGCTNQRGAGQLFAIIYNALQVTSVDCQKKGWLHPHSTINKSTVAEAVIAYIQKAAC